MLGLGCNAQLPEFKVQVLHEGSDPLSYGTEIVVIHFLALVSRCAEKSSSRKYHIGTSEILRPVHKEILLLRSYRRCYLGSLGVSEYPHDTKSLFRNCLHGTKERGLLVKSFACIGAECSRDTQNNAGCIFLEESRGGYIPNGISSCLECSPESARRER